MTNCCDKPQFIETFRNGYAQQWLISVVCGSCGQVRHIRQDGEIFIMREKGEIHDARKKKTT